MQYTKIASLTLHTNCEYKDGVATYLIHTMKNLLQYDAQITRGDYNQTTQQHKWKAWNVIWSCMVNRICMVPSTSIHGQS